MSGTPPSLSTPFSQQLREATDAQHRDAEDSPFMRALVDGRAGRASYPALAGQLWFVYVALEAAADALADDDLVRPFLARELDRAPSLASDLRVLLGDGWAEDLRPLPATARYVGRIHEVAGTAPAAYVAHHWTRYLGDLSGGQILLRVLTRTYGFGDDSVSFFRFADIPKPKPFKDRYRAQLDTLGQQLTGEQRDQVLREAQTAFDLNRALFDELRGTIPADAA